MDDELLARVEDLLSGGASALVGCSGGADSVYLVHGLVDRFARWGARLVVCHFDHALRGRESAEDAAFVRGLAAALGLAYREGRWERAASAGPVSEAAARQARHAFFVGVSHDVGARLLFTGHHADDAAESLLLQLARGSGPHGLAIPRPWEEAGPGGLTVVRPLWNLRKRQIVEALRAKGWAWREDATNAQPLYTRNRLRPLVEALEAALPEGFVAGALRSQVKVREVAQAIEGLAERFDVTRGELEVAQARSEPVAVTRRVLERWLEARGLLGRLRPVVQDGILAAIRLGSRGRWSVGDEGWLTLEGGSLRLEAPPANPHAWAPTTLPAGLRLHLPNGCVLAREDVELSGKERAAVLAGGFPPTQVVWLPRGEGQEPLVVRRWQPGDSYRPLGSPGTAKLQDLFTNRKIPDNERQVLPVVLDEAGNILWVPGLPPAEICRLAPPPGPVLKLTYQRSGSTFD